MGRKRGKFTLLEKRDIVTEAYSCVGNVSSTARAHGVAPKQIRDWRKSIAAAEASGKAINWSNKTVQRNDGRRLNQGYYAELKAFLDSLLRLESNFL